MAKNPHNINWRKELSLILVTGLTAVILYLLLGHYNFIKDISRYKTNTLSNTTLSLLETFDAPIQVTLYSEDYDTKLSVLSLLSIYSAQTPNIVFTHHTTPPSPEEQHKLGFATNGLKIQYKNITQAINLNSTPLTEMSFSQALFKLKRAQNQWVVFVEGHKEPSPFGRENRDLRVFSAALEKEGLKIQSLNLANFSAIPENTVLLILAAPQIPLLPYELTLIKSYIDSGKNFLWLMGQEIEPQLSDLQSILHIKRLPGIIMDLHGQKMGTPHPGISLVTQYNNTPITHPQAELTAFPWAVALKPLEGSPWKTQSFLQTHADTWTQTGPLSEKIGFKPEEGEVAGPLSIGYLLTKNIQNNDKETEQRIIVVGNTQFLSNGTIHNYGNLDLGLHLINWLSTDDALLAIPFPASSKPIVGLTYPVAFCLQTIYPYGLPIVLLGIGLLYRYKRNRLSAKILYQVRTKNNQAS
ncbi:MAG TPA: Gldg family protein [Gammaproteobacteria bacterium]|nr:Gldg family protein [Gammaproteobacteria bacterium]